MNILFLNIKIKIHIFYVFFQILDLIFQIISVYNLWIYIKTFSVMSLKIYFESATFCQITIELNLVKYATFC